MARFILSPSLRRCSLPTPHSGEDQRKSVVHRSPIHSDPPSGAGVRGERPAPPRAATPEGAARPRLPASDPGRVCLASSRCPITSSDGPSHRLPATATAAPEPEAALGARLPEHPAAKQRGGGWGERRGSERVRGACSALWRREAGGASQPLISTWRGGRCHPLLQVRLTLESDVPKDRQPGRVASDANPYVLEL